MSQITLPDQAALPDTSNWQLSDLTLKETLGTGTFGRVRLCLHKSSGNYYAIKCLKKSEVLRMKQVEHILAEASILGSIRHPFIVNMLKTFQDDKRLYIVLEYVVGGELFSHLRKAGKFPNDVAKFYAAEVILAFEYIHSMDILYRDLKPENLLLDVGGHIKITDFGFAKKVPERTFTLCGTPEYLAPEIIQSKGHGKAVDWWALGILTYEMLVGYPPFFDESPFRIYEKILEGKVQFPKWVDGRAKDLIKGLLTTDHTKRLGTLKRGVTDIKKHKWFYGVDWDMLLARKIPAPIPVKVTAPGDSRYFDRYPESKEDKSQPLTPAQQELFKAFGPYST
jgi:protein kinase A|eukprot:TRINITY_DN2488_c0_g1_i1.p1 TRINITY_DN2488_c0_g1~~TRINITY_DN2488_c0_g1_i1.p1  ORF type:complete len:338 (+),score=65.26 TRINITY_DN2488_c0_g1_i1:60-1073(+)